MVEKAYIEKIIDKYNYKVRIPKYNKVSSNSASTFTEALSNATVCTLPGSQPYYKVGDIVWIIFEQNQSSEPVIIGQLYSEKNTTDSKLYLDENSNLKLTLQQYETRIVELENAVNLLKQKVEKLENPTT